MIDGRDYKTLMEAEQQRVTQEVARFISQLNNLHIRTTQTISIFLMQSENGRWEGRLSTDPEHRFVYQTAKMGRQSSVSPFQVMGNEYMGMSWMEALAKDFYGGEMSLARTACGNAAAMFVYAWCFRYLYGIYRAKKKGFKIFRKPKVSPIVEEDGGLADIPIEEEVKEDVGIREVQPGGNGAAVLG